MEFLINILLQDKPSKYIRKYLNEILVLIPELSNSINFNQNNVWHIYDVFEHILHVIDGVPNNPVLRLAALFHDIGKPFVYKEDENGIGHFYGHWDKSNEIFLHFANNYKLNNDIKKLISNLIIYHDKNIDKLNEDEVNDLISIFGIDGIKMLFQLKRSDLLAQNKEYHYLLGNINEQEIKILKRGN